MQFFISTLIIKRGLLLFWALWFSIAVMTNILDGLKVLDLLPATLALASGNYAFIKEVAGIYNTPDWLIAAFFLCIIIWECLAAFLFWGSFRYFRGNHSKDLAVTYSAFTISLGLWAFFILLDEIFIAYEIERTHRQLFALQLISLLVLRLLPEETLNKNH